MHVSELLSESLESLCFLKHIQSKMGEISKSFQDQPNAELLKATFTSSL